MAEQFSWKYRARAAGLVLLLLLGLSLGAMAAGRILLIDDFEHGLNPGWQEKVFHGHTRYRVVAGEGGHVLRAESRDAASGLIFRIRYDPGRYPLLRWRWKVANVLPGGDAHKKSGDDYAARIYVIFPSWLPWRTRSLNYIWANRLPKGAHLPNPFFAGAVMIAVESGPRRTGRWVAEERNVDADYRRVFGEKPPQVGAIAVMTDTDNTGGSAVAWYDDIEVAR